MLVCASTGSTVDRGESITDTLNDASGQLLGHSGQLLDPVQLPGCH
jgi:hypothetical protein